MVKPGYKQTEVGAIPEDWQVRRLGDIGKAFVNGGTPSTKIAEYWTGNIPWITGADVIDQKVAEIRRGITKEAILRSSTNVVEKGNLLIVTRTGVGKLAITPFDLAISQDLTGVYVDQTTANTSYVYHYLNHNVDALKNLNQGTSIAGVTRETLLNIPLCLPSIQEQRAIAEALGEVDALLVALERLIAKKRDVKTAVMQQLLTGERRLPGFTGRWVTRTFGECFAFLPTGSNSRRELKAVGDVGYIHYGDIHTNWSLILDCDTAVIPYIDGEKVSKLPLLQEGDLIIADASEDYEGVGSSVEVRNIGERRIVAGLHTLLLRADKRILADGFKAYITTMRPVRDGLQKIATGISVYGISKANLRDVEIPMPPTVEEQQAIAAILSDMEAEITALQARHAKTQAIKQGMMQELLTGRTRLV